MPKVCIEAIFSDATCPHYQAAGIEVTLPVTDAKVKAKLQALGYRNVSVKRWKLI